MPESTGDYFSIQWHVTAKCDQRCKHCYVYDKKSYQKELSNELSFNDCINILNDIHNTVINDFDKKLKINFSGGDPLLRLDFLDILSEAKNKGIAVGILGNPYHITKKVAKKLFKIGLNGYQVSIDGLEKTHNEIRGVNSFEKTLRGIKILKDEGIKVAVMFTISKINKHNLLDVVKLCDNKNVDTFAFDSIIPVGNAESIKNLLLSKYELRDIMLKYMHYTDKLIEAGSKTSFRKKGNLWTLLESEMGLETKLVNASRTNNKICAGCIIGISSLSILSDGTVYPCRRLPMKIGKFPEQTIKEVFFGDVLNGLRQEHKLENCGSCKFITVCRGCRALAYTVANDYFAKDPHCWKN